MRYWRKRWRLRKLNHIGHNTRESVLAAVSPEPNSGCHLWTGDFYGDGYGRVGFAGVRRAAHRVVYELLVGPIPDGLEIDHLCRVRACCNPEHLEAVTQAENVRRAGGAGKGNRNKTHCRHGHPFYGTNLVIRGGRRRCRACMNAACLARYHAQKRHQP